MVAVTTAGFAGKVSRIAVPTTAGSCFCSQATRCAVRTLAGDGISIYNCAATYASALPSIMFATRNRRFGIAAGALTARVVR